MVKAQQKIESGVGQEISGVERLEIRISSMVNHPTAQARRRVKIHRLEMDGDREWDEVLGLLSETDGVDLTFNDDESVTLRWDASADEDHDADYKFTDAAPL